jgi:hypothetical protein
MSCFDAVKSDCDMSGNDPIEATVSLGAPVRRQSSLYSGAKGVCEHVSTSKPKSLREMWLSMSKCVSKVNHTLIVRLSHPYIGERGANRAVGGYAYGAGRVGSVSVR